MPRNKSEKRPPWMVELVTFALLCESMNYRESLAHGQPLRKARNGLSPEARDHYNPMHLMMWKGIAEHILERYGRDGAQQK